MQRTKISLLLAALLALPTAGAFAQDAAAPKTERAAAAAWSEDGLEKVDVKGLDVVYARPDASLAEYQRVLLRPIDITFRRESRNSGSLHRGKRMNSTDMDRIRAKLDTLLRDEVTKELAAGGYTLADSAGDDVLGVELSITDLHIVAPDVNQAGRSEVYALSAGEMTLVAELRDSASGETLVRIYDHKVATESGIPRRITLGENAAESRKIAVAWAKALRRGLDGARARDAAAP